MKCDSESDGEKGESEYVRGIIMESSRVISGERDELYG